MYAAPRGSLLPPSVIIRVRPGGEEAAPMHAALDAANAVFKWHRRIAGDARKKNKFLQAIYKGA